MHVSVQGGNQMALPVNFQVSVRIGRNICEAHTVAHVVENRFKSGVRRNKVKVHFQKFHVPRYGNSIMTLLTCSTRISVLFFLSTTSEMSRKVIPKLGIGKKEDNLSYQYHIWGGVMEATEDYIITQWKVPFCSIHYLLPTRPRPCEVICWSVDLCLVEKITPKIMVSLPCRALASFVLNLAILFIHSIYQVL